jgi:hypothetical protein
MKELKRALDDLSKQYLAPGSGLEGWYTTQHLDEVRYRLRMLFGRDFLSSFNGSFITMLTTMYAPSPQPPCCSTRGGALNFPASNCSQYLFTAIYSYPDHVWREWKFVTTNVPSGFWDNVANQRRFFDSIVSDKNFASLDGFYELSTKDVNDSGGAGLLSAKYNRSVYQALQAVYPEHKWIGWKFSTLPTGFWDDYQNRRDFFDSMIKNLGISIDRPENLKKITTKHVKQHGGAWMLAKFYNNSVSDAISDIYPALRWRIRLTSESSEAESSLVTVPSNLYDEFRDSLSFFIGRGANGEPQRLERLYEISNADVIAAGGKKMLRHFGDSLYLASKTLYPQHNWLGWKFQRTPANFWRDLSNQRDFVLHILSKDRPVPLTPSTVSLVDMYTLTTEKFHREGGASLLQEYYRGNIEIAVRTIFPELSANILSWKFEENAFSRTFWSRPENQTASLVRSFLEHMAQHPLLSISDVKSWERVSYSQLRQVRMSNFASALGGLMNALLLAYPDVEWSDSKSIKRTKASSQRSLVEILRSFFPDRQILEAHLISEGFQVDAFIPELNIAFEYQGRQHFDDVTHVGEATKSFAVDSVKAAALQKRSISLIEVFYGKSNSIDVSQLLNQIRDARPDLQLPNFGFPGASESTSVRSGKETKEFLDLAFSQLGLGSMEDWYTVSLKSVKDLDGGLGVLKRHANSLRAALQHAYPGHDWKDWRFKRVPPGFWDSRENRQRFFLSLLPTPDERDLTPLYALSSDAIIEAGGGGLLANNYAGSVIRALQDTFPEHEWLEWRFATVPLNFWSEEKNVKKFMEWYGFHSSRNRDSSPDSLMQGPKGAQNQESG